MSKIKLFISALFLVFLSIGAMAQSSVCLDFEDLKPGDRYGKTNDQTAGTVIYQEGGIDLSLRSFLYPNGTEGFENLLIEDANVYDSTASGVVLFPSNINLKFDLSNLPSGKKKVCLDFRYFGGDINFAVNGETPFIFSNLADFLELQNKEFDGYSIDITAFSTARQAGTLCIEGENLTELLIGGQEFTIDNFCVYFGYGDPNDCDFDDLIVEPQPCTPNGIFYLDLEFKSPRDSGEYKVTVNNQVFGPFEYPLDSFLTVGPIQPYGDRFFNVTVYDSNEPDCQISTVFEQTCFDICQINDLVVEAELCPGDSVGRVYLDFNVDVPNIANTTFKVWIDSMEFGDISLLRLPFMLEIPAEYLTKEEVPFTVCIKPNLATGDECCVNGKIIVKGCDDPCQIEDMKVEIVNCYDDQTYDLYVDAAFKYQYRDAPVQVLVDGKIVDTIRSGSFPITLKGIPVYTKSLLFPVTLCPLWDDTSTSADRCCLTFNVNKGGCPPICPIEAIDAKIIECLPNGNFDIWVKIDYSYGFEGSPVLVYVEGENFGAYEVGSDGLLLKDVPVYTDALTFSVKVCPVSITTDPNNPNLECCQYIELNKENCNGQSSGDCTFFDDLDPGYFSGADYSPGTEILNLNNISFRLFELQNLDWSVSYDHLKVTTASEFPDFEAASGQILFYNGISTVLSFSEYEEEVHEVHIDFYNAGGHLNVAANGSPIQIISLLTPGVYPLGNGVEMKIATSSIYPNQGKVSFYGNIQALLIGGQELAIDNLCVNELEEPCDIRDITLEQTECDANGTYYLKLDFIHENTSDYFVVANNYNNTVERFAYKELPVKLGPFNGAITPGPERLMVFEVFDAENDDCAARAEVGPYHCNAPCVIESARALDIECDPNNGLYHFTLEIDGANLGDVLTLSNQNGFIKRFEYQGEPVRISGIPLPVDGIDKLTVCGGLQANDAYQCCYDFRVQLDCAPLTCEIREVKIYDLECDPASGLYHFSMKVDGDYLGEVLFLSNDNGYMEALPYNGAPIRVSGVPLPNAQFDKFYLCAKPLPADGFECCYDFRIELNCQPVCNIDYAEAFDFECFPDGTYSFSLKMDGTGIENGAFVLRTSSGFEAKFLLDGNIARIDNLPYPTNGANVDAIKICSVNDSGTSDCCYGLEYRINCMDDCGFAEVKLYDFECDSDNTYSVALKVQGADFLYGKIFNLKTEGGYEYRFEWNGEPIRLEGIPKWNNEGIDRMKICVANLENCCLDISYAIECGPIGECQIGDLITETTPCEEDGTFFIDLNFRHQNTSDGFEAYVNGQPVGAYQYADLPVRLGPIMPGTTNSGQYKLEIKDWAGNCYAETVVEACSPSPACAFESVDLITKDCLDGFFQVVAELNLNNKEGGFLVFAEGELFGPYRYSDNQRIVLGPFPGDGVTSYDFLFVDLEDPTCYYYQEIGVVSCEDEQDCKVDNLQAKVIDCNDDGSYRVYIDFGYKNPGNDLFDVIGNDGSIIGTLPLDALPMEVDLSFPDPSKVQTIGVCINDQTDCCQRTQIELPDCDNSCDGLPFRARALACDSDGMFNIALDIDMDLAVIYPIVIKINGAFYDSVQVANTNFKIGPFPADSSYTISIIDVWHPECISSLDLGEVTCQDDCDITDVQMNLVNCNANGSYELYLNLEFANDRERVLDLKDANGEKIRSFKSSELPVIIPEVKVSGDAPYLYICEQESDCCIKTFVQFPECIPCNFTEVEGYVAKCEDNNQFYIGIKADWKLDEIENYIVIQGDIAYPFIINADGEVFIGPFYTTDTRETLEFWLSDARIPNCEQKFEVSIKDACSQDGDDVWPGDANQDNIANHLDLINLGIAWGKQGPARTLAGTRWTGVPASSWGELFSAESGDIKHADCNGDGIVDGDDIDVIRKNYNLRHGNKEDATELPSTDFDPPLFFDLPDTDGLPDSGYFDIPIVLGSADNPLSDIYGVAFTVEFDPEVIDPNDVEISYPTSWLGEPGVNLQALSYKYLGKGKIEIAITRTDQNEVSGYGVVAMFRGIRDDIVGRSESQMDINRSYAVRADQSLVSLHGLSKNAIFDKKTTDQKYGFIDLKRGMRVYPNPTSSMITIDNYFGVPIDAVQILTPNGKVMSPRYQGTTQLDVSSLPDGLYLIRVEIEGYIIHQKLFKSKSW